jgi:hypothetical protein
MLTVRRSKLYYRASGIITPIGGGPVHGTILRRRRRRRRSILTAFNQFVQFLQFFI